MTQLKVQNYSRDEQKAIQERLISAISSGKTRKCEVEKSTGLKWLNVHRIALRKVCPHNFSCMVLEPFLDRLERNGHGK